MNLATLRSNIFTAACAPSGRNVLPTFRVLFGLLMCIDTVYTWYYLDTFFPPWEFRPAPPGWTFLEHLSRPGDEWLFYILTAASMALMCGFWTRASAAVFCVIYSYLHLFDPTQFNNHNYLIALLAGCFALIPANERWSVRQLRSGFRVSRQEQAWHLWLFQFHVVLVYFYGGLNKINADWLLGEPMRIWLAVESDMPILGHWLAHPAAGMVFAWGGLVFDLCIPWLLLWRRTHWYAIAATLVFHGTNVWVFDIGVFPWFMVAVNVLFLTADDLSWFRRMFFAPQASLVAKVPAFPPPCVNAGTRWGTGLLLVYLGLQLLLPFRHVLLGPNVEWTEEGKNYSWRMMLSHKDTFVGIQIVDLSTGLRYEVDQRKHLSDRQRRGKGVWGSPRMLAAYARFLRRQAIAARIRHPAVYVDAVASLNGRPFQYLVSPDIDLSTAPEPWFVTPDWIVPLAPNQAIGNYAISFEEKHRRVMAVINSHRTTAMMPLSSVEERGHARRPQMVMLQQPFLEPMREL